MTDKQIFNMLIFMRTTLNLDDRLTRPRITPDAERYGSRAARLRQRQPDLAQRELDLGLADRDQVR
ncbi:MAG: hypothetical protein ACRELU_07860, partial [Gemmatimonadota bacterium]